MSGPLMFMSPAVELGNKSRFLFEVNWWAQTFEAGVFTDAGINKCACSLEAMKVARGGSEHTVRGFSRQKGACAFVNRKFRISKCG